MAGRDETMISEQELIDLGEQFGIDIGEAEVESLREKVEAVVAELEPIDDLSVGGVAGFGERSWEPPADDPHNALTVRCHVPPADDGILDDLRVGVKDNIALAGVPMECASEVMQGIVPGTDAAVVERLREAGATITAKTNLDEFAGAPHGLTGRGPPLRNPHNPEHIPGGSSGGSGVAVATGQVDVALGTDTGGSVRMPAAFCGTVGLKSTYGLVPLTGVLENTYTLDHVGTLSRTVGDSARALESMAGKDTRDPASLQAAGRNPYRVGGYVDAVESPPAVGDLDLGVLVEGVGEGVRRDVAERVEATLERLEDAGATIREVSVDSFHKGLAIKNCLSYVEMAAHWRAGGAPLRRGGVVDEGLQAGFARRAAASSGEMSEFYRTKLLAGTVLLDRFDGRRYTRAQAAREVLRTEFEEALADLDALVLPTMPEVAPPIEDAFEPGFDYARNTRAADVTRLPAVTIPDGTVSGLPVGFQLVGRAFEDDTLLGVAERISDYTAAVPEP